MRMVFRVVGVVLVVWGLYSLMTQPVYEVRFDFANNEVVEIRDNEGKRVQKTLDDLKREGIMYDIVYVQPRTMGNN